MFSAWVSLPDNPITSWLAVLMAPSDYTTLKEVWNNSFSQHATCYTVVHLLLYYCFFLVKPLLVWNTFVPYGVAVVHVQWVETCPGLFLVQDSLNTLYMWWVKMIYDTRTSYYKYVKLYKLLSTSGIFCRMIQSQCSRKHKNLGVVHTHAYMHILYMYVHTQCVHVYHCILLHNRIVI